MLENATTAQYTHTLTVTGRLGGQYQCTVSNNKPSTATAQLTVAGSAYVSFLGTNLPNHGYVNLTLVGDTRNGSDSVQCHTDLSTCCNDAQGSDRGDWYFPNGERLDFGGHHGDIYQWRLAKRVDLHQRNSGVISGIYCCTIETNAVHNNDHSDTTTRETVYVGLYANGGECI